MTTTIKERMLVVWNDDGSFRGASLDERIIYDDGGTRNTQRALSEDDADELIGTTASAALAQVETLTAERDEALAANAPLVEQVAALQARIDELTSVPEMASITPRQAKLALYGAGLLDAVESAVAGADRVVQIHYQDATVWTRNDPVLAGLANALGITDEQLDQLFATAAGL